MFAFQTCADETAVSAEDTRAVGSALVTVGTPPVARRAYTFADMFAGIGGFHRALNNLGLECVLAAEINPDARASYLANFPDIHEHFVHDIRSLAGEKLANSPDFDILCAGFPCQAYSRAGHKGGLRDPRGNLFFELPRILKEKRPAAFMFENVPGLLAHDDGKTWDRIRRHLHAAGYSVHCQRMNAKDFGLAQDRARLLIVGFCRNRYGALADCFAFPTPTGPVMTMTDVFGQPCVRKVGYTIRCGGRNSGIGSRHNWDAYEMADGNVRILTPREGLIMQGFPLTHFLSNSPAKAMHLLGNAVAVPVIREVARAMLARLDAMDATLEERSEKFRLATKNRCRDSVLGPSIKQARNAAGLSQEALAKRAGLTKMAIDSIESGGGRYDTLLALADALGLQIVEEPRLPTGESLGQRLAAYRRKRGGSQRDVVKWSGVTQPTVDRIEDGATQVHVAGIEKLAAGLGVSLSLAAKLNKKTPKIGTNA